RRRPARPCVSRDARATIASVPPRAGRVSAAAHLRSVSRSRADALCVRGVGPGVLTDRHRLRRTKMNFKMKPSVAVAALALGALGISAAVVGVAVTGGGDSANAAETGHMAMSGMNGMQMAGMTATTAADHWRGVAGSTFQSDGVTRTYYIAADKV